MKKILLVLAFLSSTAAYAETSSNWYIGAEAGAASVEDQTSELASMFVATVGGAATATQDKSVGVGRIFGGYKINELVSLEAGYFISSDIKYRVSGVSGGLVAYNAALDISYSGFDYSVLLRPFESTPAKGIFIKAGGHRSKYDASISISAAGISAGSSFDDSGNGLLYGVGYDFDVQNNLFGRAALIHYSKIAGDSDSKATTASIGIGFKF